MSERKGTLKGYDSEQERACGHACAARNVSCNFSRWQEHDGKPLMQLVQLASAKDLFVFGHGLPPLPKKQLLRDAMRPGAPATVVCADDVGSCSRALVLDNAKTLDELFLGEAAEVCSRLELSPVVLSVAASERAARLRQQQACQIMLRRGVNADFDYLVGCEGRSAVAQVARWRRCQIVIGRNEALPSWRRWLRDTTLEDLMYAWKSLGFMALSQANGEKLLAPAAVAALRSPEDKLTVR